MSNLIWKMPDQKPDSRKQILIYDGVDYSIEISHPEYWEDKGLVEKWCYLSDLVAQADKAERLQKAVDIAKEALKYARQRGLDNTATLFAVGSKADKALETIGKHKE